MRRAHTDPVGVLHAVLASKHDGDEVVLATIAAPATQVWGAALLALLQPDLHSRLCNLHGDYITRNNQSRHSRPCPAGASRPVCQQQAARPGGHTRRQMPRLKRLMPCAAKPASTPGLVEGEVDLFQGGVGQLDDLGRRFLLRTQPAPRPLSTAVPT